MYTFFCHRQSMSVPDILRLSQTVSVCHSQSVSAKAICDSVRQSVSVTNSQCLPQAVCVC